MDIEKKLIKFKKNYQDTNPSEKFLKDGWQDLQGKIMDLEKAQIRRGFFYFRPFAFLVLTIFFLTAVSAGIIQASQKSLPGQPLYPIKRTSEDILSAVSGGNVVKVENRAKEVVELNKKNEPEQVSKAVEEYKKAVDEAVSSGKNTEEIKKKLQEQETEFEQIKQGTSEKEINEAIEISKSGRGDEDKEEEKDEEDKNEDDPGSDSGSNSGKEKED